jgi:hypothetical protein
MAVGFGFFAVGLLAVAFAPLAALPFAFFFRATFRAFVFAIADLL